MRHADGILGGGDGGVHEDSVIAKLHRDGRVRCSADAGVHNQRNVGDHLAQDAEVGQILDAQAAADRRTHRHNSGRSGVDQAARVHQIVVGIGQHDESFFHQHPRSFEEPGVIGEQRLLIADDFEFHPVRQAHLAAQAGGADRLIGRIAGGGIGQQEKLGSVDMIEQGFLRSIGEIDAPHRDGNHFGSGSLVAAGHFGKTAVFARADKQS